MLKRLALFGASAALVVVVLAALVGCAIIFQSRFEERQKVAASRMKVGDHEAKLLELVGPPTYKTDGTRWVEPEFEKSEQQLTPGCTTEYWYESGIPLLAEKFAYCFDASGKFLDSSLWASW